MEILVIGGHGTIGKRVVKILMEKAKVIIGGRTQGDVVVDMADSTSIKNMFEEIGMVDAVVCIAGEAKWGHFEDLTEEDYYIGLKSKLMGQVNVVRVGQQYVKEGGSFTLTTGILADDPVVRTASAAMVNGGIHSFVKAASLELKKGHRLNAVTAGMVEDAYEKYKDYFPGHNPIPMKKVVNGYIRSIFGKGNGEIIRIYD
ncbi:short chain dehydrogenase [Allomuricauda sp. SCSIO 65647]|uniref:short chain dehydrogenase n=1 Tax=Allomuricauda sp. SCSIO 65647 TaxID=2908843 RepID=UPI001F2645E1|nr:short chain dehydrogenase [Muricauda sp. SCSIO 65647]UJH67437.1 short chain dehydrogenase [Muricauda sp. SCSIO 65647]